jgi:hypothetical protein
LNERIAYKSTSSNLLLENKKKKRNANSFKVQANDQQKIESKSRLEN